MQKGRKKIIPLTPFGTKWPTNKLSAIRRSVHRLPRAIADAKGPPHKSEKRNARDFFHGRYDNVTSLSGSVMEGVFMIQCTQFQGISMKQYTVFLLDQHVRYYMQTILPKYTMCNKTPIRSHGNSACIHNHTLFRDELQATTKWRDHLHCTVCKQRILNYGRESLLQLAPSIFSGNQKSGYADRQSLLLNTSEVGDPTFDFKAEEADTRLWWLHVFKPEGSRKLLFSPGTDTLFIGLGVANVLTMDVVILI